MPYAIRKALEDANLKISDVDGIAFTKGPGVPVLFFSQHNQLHTQAWLEV